MMQFRGQRAPTCSRTGSSRRKSAMTSATIASPRPRGGRGAAAVAWRVVESSGAWGLRPSDRFVLAVTRTPTSPTAKRAAAFTRLSHEVPRFVTKTAPLQAIVLGMIIAHRGASAYAPEHTFAAYDLALRMGADVLEIDIRVTADATLVAVHDATLARTTGDPRRVDEVRLGDLPPELRPLTLDAVLERYGDATRYVVDLKDPRAPVERMVAAAVTRHRLRDRVEVQTFDRRSLRRARAASLAQLYPPPVGHADVLRDIRRVASFADAIGPLSQVVDGEVVRTAHAHRLRVQPYTVNDPGEMKRLLELGVDALITDRPDVAVAAAG
jgi:glycerophosphoryl diester phosphodiesterase